MDKMKHTLSVMVRAFIIAVCLLISCPLYSQLTPVSNSKGKWGYEDSNGTLVIKHKFNGASEFNNGVALVRNGNKYGIINEAGKFIVKPDYDMITEFNPLGLAEVMKGDKHGFVDLQGKLVIPCKYRFVGGFNTNGLVWVNDGGKMNKQGSAVTGGKFSVLRSDGSSFFDKPHSIIGCFIPWKTSYSKSDLNKMSLVERNLTEGDDYSFWRKSLITFTPGSLLPENIHAYYVSDKDGGYYNGVYSADGREIVPAGKYYFVNCPEDGISVVFPKKGKANFLHLGSGRMVFKENLDGCWGFKDGHCIGIFGGLHYIYDVNGQRKSAGYTKIYPLNNGVHVVRNGNDQYGMIAADGSEILPAVNYAVYPCIEGRSLVKEKSSSTIGYMDNKGEWVVEPVYNAGLSFSGGNAMVKHNGKWGMIDIKNNTVLPFEYDDLKKKLRESQTWIWAKRSDTGAFECYDIAKGSMVIPSIYKDAYAFGSRYDGLAMVKKQDNDASWGWIDENGVEVVPCVFSESHAFKAGKEYEESGRSPWTSFSTYIFTLHNNHEAVDLKSVIDESLWDY